jgi:hypothetical protein
VQFFAFLFLHVCILVSCVFHHSRWRWWDSLKLYVPDGEESLMMIMITDPRLILSFACFLPAESNLFRCCRVSQSFLFPPPDALSVFLRLVFENTSMFKSRPGEAWASVIRYEECFASASFRYGCNYHVSFSWFTLIAVTGFHPVSQSVVLVMFSGAACWRFIPESRSLIWSKRSLSRESSGACFDPSCDWHSFPPFPIEHRYLCSPENKQQQQHLRFRCLEKRMNCFPCFWKKEVVQVSVRIGNQRPTVTANSCYWNEAAVVRVTVQSDYRSM